MSFAEKLRALREQYGLSQQQLAEAIGVTRQAVSLWERGSTLPDSVTLLRLAEEFNVEAEWLLDDTRTGEPEPRRVKRGRFTMTDRVWCVIAAAAIIYTIVYNVVFIRNIDGIVDMMMLGENAYWRLMALQYANMLIIVPWLYFALGHTAGALFCRYVLTPAPKARRIMRIAAVIALLFYVAVLALSVILRVTDVAYGSMLQIYYARIVTQFRLMLVPGALFALSRARVRV